MALTYHFDNDCFGEIKTFLKYAYLAQEFKSMAVQAPHPISDTTAKVCRCILVKPYVNRLTLREKDLSLKMCQSFGSEVHF